MYIIKVNGMKVKSCRSFNEARAWALKHNGKVFSYSKVKLPKSTMLSYNDKDFIKREMYKEIYSENNHGYHITQRRKKYE
ncbi:hypothetical protein SAMN05660484_02222 [Eubacterium ruminantium]|uniref:Uncharacterized protein n=1 Tax=Eubacterium ruminantium TaxID=42322 RepID=A0A1T4Q698_9FIRM|nr:hypothetical protein [Eubacterium ruminantium]SCW64112.1 hypothetical protein SAMN05660484_02222 [Eubacterium ruminantium]SDN30985.1 hypothetical protein SAMN04490370_11648 [Eubacterium ruminantium]SJZ98758.1 hypothetical protein SAMN02745110_02261 [Eubacterium ruminantium]